MLTSISIPLNATIQQRLQLCLNEKNTEYPPIYRYFHIRKTLYEWKLELTTANLTKEAIQKQLYNKFKTTAGSTNSRYRLRAALRLYDLFHICENVLQNPIFQPLKIQYIRKLTELKFQQFSNQISLIILDYYLEITNSTWTSMELNLEEEVIRLQTAVTPKQIQPPTWKKTRVELPANPSYHYTPGKRRSSKIIWHPPIELIQLQQILLQQPQQPFQQPQQQLQQPNLDLMAYVPIAKLKKFTGKKDDTQIWLNDIKKAIAANGWNDQRALQAILYFL
ncbi:hypothetical protein G9A89_018574 [Geosiphon pyriformis]|nr:hypothetical protein G9A89_018574 [Geosiphon pyriformis]